MRVFEDDDQYRRRFFFLKTLTDLRIDRGSWRECNSLIQTYGITNVDLYQSDINDRFLTNYKLFKCLE